MYSKGIMWLDDCRIPFVDEENISGVQKQKAKGTIYGEGRGFHKSYIEMEMYKQQGRFTPSLLVCDDMLNDGSVSEAKANLNYKWNNTDGGGDIFNNRGTYTPRNDKGTNSRYYDLDLWFDKMLEKL